MSKTKVLSFRMPQGWSALLDRLAHQYHFASRGELLSLAITECVYNSLRGKKVKKGNIETPTEVIACRLPVATYEAIQHTCCKQLKDTASIWAASAIYQWYQALLKEDKRQQRGNMYFLFVRDYALKYREKVSVYNIDRGINEQ